MTKSVGACVSDETACKAAGCLKHRRCFCHPGRSLHERYRYLVELVRVFDHRAVRDPHHFNYRSAGTSLRLSPSVYLAYPIIAQRYCRCKNLPLEATWCNFIGHSAWHLRDLPQINVNHGCIASHLSFFLCPTSGQVERTRPNLWPRCK